MAYLFDDANPDYLVASAAALVAYPAAFSAWVYPDAALDMHLVGMANSAASVQYWRLLFQAGGRIYMQKGNTAVSNAISTTTAGLNQWAHGCGVCAGPTDNRAFLNGGGKGTNATSVALSTAMNRTSVGYLARLSPTNYASGRIAEPAIWDLSAWPGATAIDKADYFETHVLPLLAAGASPLLFPRGLVFYRDLVRGVNRPAIGPALSIGGSPTVAVHPRIFTPRGPLFTSGPRAPVAGPPFRVAAAAVQSLVSPRGVHLPALEAGEAFLPGAVAGRVVPLLPPHQEEPC